MPTSRSVLRGGPCSFTGTTQDTADMRRQPKVVASNALSRTKGATSERTACGTVRRRWRPMRRAPV